MGEIDTGFVLAATDGEEGGQKNTWYGDYTCSSAAIFDFRRRHGISLKQYHFMEDGLFFAVGQKGFPLAHRRFVYGL